MNFDLALSTDVLRRTPETLRELLGDLPEPWVRGTEGAETFSPFDVVGHLIVRQLSSSGRGKRSCHATHSRKDQPQEIPMKWLKVL